MELMVFNFDCSQFCIRDHQAPGVLSDVILIGKLHSIERERKDATPEVRYLARLSDSVPVLAELQA